MEFLSSRDLRLNPKQVWKKLRKEGFGIVTLNGKPQFLLSSIEPSQVEEALYLFRRIRAEMAIEAIGRQAREKGLDKMTMEEIDEVIQEVRREARKKENK